MSFVRLVDWMPRENLDSAIVQAARVSYGQGTKTVSSDRALIRYLMRHSHTTPFEMVEFKFHIKCPIFVARQWLRHRTASVNEVSARYSEMAEEFFEPEHFRIQSVHNHQLSETPLDSSSDEYAQIIYSYACVDSFNAYTKLLGLGCGREMARSVLPVGTLTEFYWKINLHNLLNFLRLRIHPTAQYEIRILAEQMADIIKPLIPLTWEAFMDFRLNSITLTAPEIQAIKDGTKTIEGSGENREFQEKLKFFNHQI